MKNIISSLTIIALTLTSHIANADSYWGFGVSDYTIKGSESGIHVSTDASAIEGIIGLNTSPNIAWEARIGLGIDDRDVTYSLQGQSGNTGLKNKLNSYVSGYFKPQFVGNNYHVYGLLGYSRVSNTLTSVDDGSEDTNDSGFSYGLGIGLMSSNDSVNLEWKNLAKIDNGDIKGLTLGYQHTF